MLFYIVARPTCIPTTRVRVYFRPPYSVSVIYMHLFLCQNHAVLTTVALQHRLTSGRVMPPALFFLLRIALAILGLLWFH